VKEDEMAGEATQEKFFKLAEIADVALVDGVTARFVTGERMMFSFVRLAPGKEVPLHSHPHEQLGHIIEGSLLMTIAGEEREIRAGDAYVIPGGVLHKAIGGPQGGLALDVFAPVREDYVELARQQAQKDPN
jgi:quercetin dioxygenase-like cupin family protein